MSLYKGSQLISGAMPNSANQSLSNLNSAGQDIIDGKVDLDYSNADYQPVNKAGDTMTGTLNIRKNNPSIYLKYSNFTKGANPSSNIYWECRAEDSNTNPAEWYTNRVGNFVTTMFTNGTVETAMFAYQNDPNSSASAVMQTQITSAGVASCSFPNTTCVDGQFVSHSTAVVSSAISLNGSSYLTYTLDLPNDGRNYEVILFADGDTGNTSGDTLTIKIGSDICPATIVAKNRTRASNTVALGGSITIPVSSSHKIYVSRQTNWKGNLTSMDLLAYRRIGTNA